MINVSRLSLIPYMHTALAASQFGFPEAISLTHLFTTGDWNSPGGIWDYNHANSDPWNINGGLNGVTDIGSFGD